MIAVGKPLKPKIYNYSAAVIVKMRNCEVKNSLLKSTQDLFSSNPPTFHRRFAGARRAGATGATGVWVQSRWTKPPGHQDTRGWYTAKHMYSPSELPTVCRNRRQWERQSCEGMGGEKDKVTLVLLVWMLVLKHLYHTPDQLLRLAFMTSKQRVEGGTCQFSPQTKTPGLNESIFLTVPSVSMESGTSPAWRTGGARWGQSLGDVGECDECINTGWQAVRRMARSHPQAKEATKCTLSRSRYPQSSTIVECEEQRRAGSCGHVADDVQSETRVDGSFIAHHGRTRV